MKSDFDREGITASRLSFSDFDNSPDCGYGNSAPVSFIRGSGKYHFDYHSSFADTTVVDSRPLFVNACSLDAFVYKDILLSDSDSSMNPNTASTFAGASSIMSSNDQMMAFAGGVCTTYEDSCLSYW